MVFSLVAAVLMIAWAAPVLAADQQSVNVNTADLEELMTLDRVGEAYAKRIVAYREKNGPFKSTKDLLLVKGIGPKILEANQDRIKVRED
jgi:competence protein ComEA